MRIHPFASFTLGAVCVLSLSAALQVRAPQDPARAQDPVRAQDAAREQEPDIAAMMAKAQRYVQPGEHHKKLARFVGRWNTETRVFMGGKASPPEKGTSEFRWLMQDRWMVADGKGSMMGMPMQSFWLLGYDNFKMSYVVTTVTTFDTAMLRSEGDMTHDGKALITYGTLDEYLTGEHDKMVKYVWRLESDDRFTVEVHDLPIGEHNTKVIEIAFMRAG
jgi:hypothetical protein